jgi:hypothetical protein
MEFSQCFESQLLFTFGKTNVRGEMESVGIGNQMDVRC